MSINFKKSAGFVGFRAPHELAPGPLHLHLQGGSSPPWAGCRSQCTAAGARTSNTATVPSRLCRPRMWACTGARNLALDPTSAFVSSGAPHELHTHSRRLSTTDRGTASCPVYYGSRPRKKPNKFGPHQAQEEPVMQQAPTNLAHRRQAVISAICWCGQVLGCSWPQGAVRKFRLATTKMIKHATDLPCQLLVFRGFDGLYSYFPSRLRSHPSVRRTDVVLLRLALRMARGEKFPDDPVYCTA